MFSRPAEPSDGPAVLVVEDQDDFRQALQAHLEHEGYRTIGCRDALEALTTLQSGTRVCLIVLDLKLPGLTGFQFREAQQLDAAIRDIPLVVLSGVRRPGDYDANLDAIAYLEKPVDTSRVVAFAREHCPCGAGAPASRPGNADPAG